MHKTNRDKLRYSKTLEAKQRNRGIKKNLTEALIVLLAVCTWFGIAYFAVTVAVGDF